MNLSLDQSQERMGKIDSPKRLSRPFASDIFRRGHIVQHILSGTMPRLGRASIIFIFVLCVRLAFGATLALAFGLVRVLVVIMRKGRFAFAMPWLLLRVEDSWILLVLYERMLLTTGLTHFSGRSRRTHTMSSLSKEQPLLMR